MERETLPPRRRPSWFEPLVLVGVVHVEIVEPERAIPPLLALLLPSAFMLDELVRQPRHGDDGDPVDFVGEAVEVARPEVVDPLGA